MVELIVSGMRVAVEKDSPDEYIRAVARALDVGEEHITIVAMLEKSLDMGDPEQFYYTVSVAAGIPERFGNPKNFPAYVRKKIAVRTPPKSTDRPVIIGFGPAGMFAALELLERGIKPVIFERGKKIEERSVDVRRFITDRVLNPQSNIQFGEGGAGAYSDGKLFSRIQNSPSVATVLDTLIAFGAPPEIAYVSKPHLGTDVLCGIVRAIRDYILQHGGEIHYNAVMTDIIIDNHLVRGVIINGTTEYRASSVYLAVGHSARDTFALLRDKGITLEQKPIAVGVRIEHPVEIINHIRYGEKYKNFSALGAATYSFNYTNRSIQRGVYTFCMCPGGEVVNASSEDGLLVINGMSYAARGSAFSNAAMVVTCHPADYPSSDPLAGIDFQKEIERKAFVTGGGTGAAPAQNLEDYLAGTVSGCLNKNSYAMGTVAADLRELFPGFINDALRSAFDRWKQESPLFVSRHAVLMGAETRTSCPVRILRGGNYASVSCANLFPIGEGSGYAGGITSSAADAVRVVEQQIG